MSEATIQRDVIARLKKIGVEVLRVNSGVIRSGASFVRLAPIGTPDVLVWHPVVAWLELKREGCGKRAKSDATRQAQEAFAANCALLGVPYLLTSDAAAAVAFVRELVAAERGAA